MFVEVAANEVVVQEVVEQEVDLVAHCVLEDSDFSLSIKCTVSDQQEQNIEVFHFECLRLQLCSFFH